MTEKITEAFVMSIKSTVLKWKNILSKIKNKLRWLENTFYAFLKQISHITMGRPDCLEDYIKKGDIYIAKQFLFKMVLCFCVVLFCITQYVYPFLRGKIVTAEIAVNTNDFFEFTGKAKVYQKDGSLLYKGILQQGNAEGQGEVYQHGKMVYKGELSENQYHGTGKLYQNDKKIYEGEFLNNQYHGTGVLYDKNGIMRYSGTFEHGNKKQGVSYFENGTMQYKGSYENGLYQGEGILYASGSENVIRYQGTFFQNQYEGKGILYQKGKMLYEGNFSKGLYQGEGILYDIQTGKILYQGTFLNGAYSGNGSLYQSNTGRLLYEGDFLEGKKNGFGTLYSENGTKIYTGAFYHDDIDYKQYIKSNLDEIREDFGRETELIMLDDAIVTVYEHLKVVFIFQFSENGESPNLKSIQFLGVQNIDNIKNGMTFYDVKQQYKQYEFVESNIQVTEQQKMIFSICDKQISTVYALTYTLNDVILTLYGEKENGVICYFEIGGIAL